MADANWRLWSSGLILGILLLWEALRPASDQHGGSHFSWFRHAGRNLFLRLINAAIIGVLFLPVLWPWASEWTTERRFGVLNWLSLQGIPRLLMAILLLDLWTYWWHRLNHKVPMLWRFHRVHHTDPQMDVTTAARFHPGEIWLSSVLRLAIIALTGVTLEAMIIYEAIMFGVVQLHHANISFRPKVDQCFRVLFPSPAMHKIHHSQLRPETNSNYSSLFSVWDFLFRSYRMRPDPQSVEFGLEEYLRPEDERMPAMLGIPFRKD